MKNKRLVLMVVCSIILVGTLGLNTSMNIVEASQAKTVSKQEHVSKYGTVVKNNYTLWKNFEWQKKGSTNILNQSTVLVKYQYKHKNGSTYYSIYSNYGTWLGYVNRDAVKLADGKQGIAKKSEKIIQVTNTNYPVHQNFSWKKKMDSKQLKNKPLTVKYFYDHINGSTYYSLYDNKGSWQGYINKKGVKEVDLTKPAQGDAIKVNEYVSVVNFNYNTYQNFGWVIKNKGIDLKNQTFQVKYKYYHRNGQVYYSLYDQLDNWQGYINEKGTKNNGPKGLPIDYKKFVSIKNQGAQIHRNLDKLDGNGIVFISNNRPLFAKHKYHRFNDNTYYSLYDEKNNWQGYVVEDELNLDVGRSGSGVEINEKVRVVEKNKNTYQDFSWKIKYQSDELLDQTFSAKREYGHFNGANYYSLYDEKGTWYGYINSEFVKKVQPVITGIRNEYFGQSNQDFDPLLGIQARDYKGNELEVTVEGDVNLQKPGIYTLKYIAMDSEGTKTIATRIITVVEKGKPILE